MPEKNNVGALRKKKAGAILTTSDNEVKSASMMDKPTVKPAPANNARIGGRPTKPKAEKRSYKIVLSLTESEGAKISQKAGIAGDATYLYARLKELGEI
jgi:hypothetical protein